MLHETEKKKKKREGNVYGDEKICICTYVGIWNFYHVVNLLSEYGCNKWD